MQEFIQQATQTLGISEATTKAATGRLLGFLDDNGPKAEVGQLLDKLPGARELMSNSAPSAGGGMLGSLAGAASALGGGGGAASLLAAIQQSGLGAGSAPQLVSMFVSYAKAKAGDDLVGRILNAVPALAA
jgi:hypothetical protein